MRYRLQRHDGTDCSATMVPITVLRMVPIQRYRHLYYVKELSHQEISAILGMNPQSSKNLLSRTLARLREFFFSVSTIWIFSILVHCVHVPVRSVWAFHFS